MDASEYLQCVMQEVDKVADYRSRSREAVCWTIGQQFQRAMNDSRDNARHEKWSVRDDKPAEFYMGEDSSSLTATFCVGHTTEGVVRRMQKINNKNPITYTPSKLVIYFDYLSDCREFEDLVKDEFAFARVCENKGEVFDKRLLDFKAAKDRVRELYAQFIARKGSATMIEQVELF